MSLRTLIFGTLLLCVLAACAYWPAVSGKSGFVWNDQVSIQGVMEARKSAAETAPPPPPSVPSIAPATMGADEGPAAPAAVPAVDAVVPVVEFQRIWTWAPDALVVPKTVAATPHYYPLSYSSLWLEHKVWGLTPAGYHVMNVLLHVAAALLVWILLARLGLGTGPAYFAATLFAVHPVNVESVVWITERSNVLSLLLMLGAGLTFVRWARLDQVEPEAAQGGRSKPLYVLTLILFVLAILAKPVAVMLPAALLLTLWWKRGKISGRDWVALLPFAVLAIGYGIFTANVERQLVVATDELEIPALSRLLLAGRATVFYLGKLFAPVKLTFIYPAWDLMALSPSVAANWIYPAGVIGVAAALVAMARRIGRGPATAAIFFLLMLVPALGIFGMLPLHDAMVADHGQYAAAIGIFALVAALGARVLNLFDPTEITLRRVTGAAAIVPIVAVLCYLSNFQSRIYAGDEALWRDTLAKNSESWLASENLAGILLKRQDPKALPEAMELLKQTVAANPKRASAYVSLGNTLLATKRYDESMKAYTAVLALEPENAEIHNDIGVIYFAMGKPSLAEKSFRQAIRYRENFADAWNNLGQVLHLERLDRDAVASFKKAIQYNPKLAIAYFNLGDTYQSLHKEMDAVDCYRAALFVDRNFAMAAASLAELLTSSADSRIRNQFEAVDLAERANRIAGEKDVTFLELLAQVYSEVGRYADAIRVQQQAMLTADKQGAPIETIRLMQQRLDAYALLKANEGLPEQ